MNTKAKLAMLTFAALALTMETPVGHNRKVEATPTNPNKKPPKGTRLFKYGQNEIYAINQKVADKKAKKQGLI